MHVMGLPWISRWKGWKWMAKSNPDSKEISKDSINCSDNKRVLKTFENTWNKEEKILSEVSSLTKHPMWLEQEITCYVTKWERCRRGHKVRSRYLLCVVSSLRYLPFPRGFPCRKKNLRIMTNEPVLLFLTSDTQLNFIRDTESYLQSSE